MSMVLNSFAFTRRGRPTKYPWAKWSDGKIYRATKGKDFDCTVPSFRGILWHYARRSGLRVQTSEEGKVKVIFQFSKE